jgi:DNA-binding NarL/FixJ family response regulator
MTGDTIRILLADDHAVVRAGLRAVLASAKDIEVVSEASSGREAVALAARVRPDVVVMDVSMGEPNGLVATREVLAAVPGTKVLILTMHGEDEYLVPLLEAGAAGYLVKSVADRELVAAVRAVAYGDTYVSPTAARVLAKGLLKKDPAQAERERYERLTQREKDVLRLVAQGHPNKRIARELAISEKTVKAHLTSIFQQLGVTDRTQAALWAQQNPF